jgi:hypothetical protein
VEVAMQHKRARERKRKRNGRSKDVIMLASST